MHPGFQPSRHLNSVFGGGNAAFAHQIACACTRESYAGEKLCGERVQAHRYTSKAAGRSASATAPVLCCLHLFSLRLSGTTSLRPQVYHLLYRPEQKSYTVQRFFCNVVLRPIFCFGLWFVLQLVGLRSEAHVLFLQGSRVGSPPVLFFRRTCPFDFTFLPNTRALALHPSSFSGTNTICVARVEFGSRPKIDTGCSKSRSGR